MIIILYFTNIFITWDILKVQNYYFQPWFSNDYYYHAKGPIKTKFTHIFYRIHQNIKILFRIIIFKWFLLSNKGIVEVRFMHIFCNNLSHCVNFLYFFTYYVVENIIIISFQCINLSLSILMPWKSVIPHF